MSEKKELESNFASVAIVLNSYFGPFMMELCRILKQQHKSKIHLYVKSDVLVDSYLKGPHSELFDSVTNFMKFWPALRQTGLDEQTVIAEALDKESRLGTTYNTLAVANRHVGRGYALAGFNHPMSNYSESSYLQMLNAYNTQLGFWESQFQDYKISLVIADNKDVAIVSRMMKIPYRCMARARYKNFHYWEDAETREANAIREAYEKIRATSTITEPKPIPPYMAGKEIIRRAMKRASFVSVLKQSVYLLLRQMYWRIKRYEKARGYHVLDQIKMTFRQRRDMRRMMGGETVTLAKLKKSKYVYYPLHVEPEQAMGQISPEFFFQLESIARISRDLPAGVYLAVKEVPMGCGRRPDNFYDQLIRLKNVVLVNMSEPGPSVIEHAVGVVTIAGTGGLEAALLGKPVISFGLHNPYNFLPHVSVVKNMQELPSLVSDMVKGGGDLSEALSNADRFIRAIEKASFDMGEFDYFELEKFPPNAPLCSYQLLSKSLIA